MQGEDENWLPNYFCIVSNPSSGFTGSQVHQLAQKAGNLLLDLHQQTVLNTEGFVSTVSDFFF